MLAKFVSATWGEETGAEAEDEGKTDTGADVQPSGPTSSDTTNKELAGPSFSLWGVAASLADSVKKNTAEITTGLKETNWRAELEAFSKGVREEEHQLRKETVKRVEVAKEHLPKDATAQLDLKRRELTAHLQKMGVGLGGLGKTLVTCTTDLFDQVRDTVVAELSANEGKSKSKLKRQGSRPLSKSKYSRLEADISSMQRDSATYCDEPADTADFQAWRSTFDLASFKPAVQDLISENAFMAELQARIVPVIVEYDAFWTRYFYRLHLLEARHAQRLQVAQRASRPQQEEELSWDDADDQHQPQEISAPATSDPNQSSPPAAADSGPSATSCLAQTHRESGDADGTHAESEAAAAPLQADPATTAAKHGNDPGDTAESHVGHEAHGAEGVSQEARKAASAAGDEDAADTVTSSESGSGNEHWTVVKSPSKQSGTEKSGTFTGASASTTSPNKAAVTAAAESKPATPLAGADSGKLPEEIADDNSEIDELDDVSNDGDIEAGVGPGSEGDEDWGAWE